MTTQTGKRPVDPVPELVLWFGVGAGPVIYAIHLAIVYFLIGVGCPWNWFSGEILGMEGLRFALLVATFIAEIPVVIAGVVAYRNFKDIRSERPKSEEARDPSGRIRFMTVLGAIFSGLFFATILLSTFPILTLDLCAFAP